MSPITVTFRRTWACALYRRSTALAVALFLAATGALTAFALEAAEGTRASFISVWAMSAARTLPFLVALLGMDVWSAERRSGRFELLLLSGVRERELVLGKFLGVLTQSILAVVLSYGLVYGAWAHGSSVSEGAVGGGALASAFAALILQGALWSATTVAASACFRAAASAAATSLILTVALPYVAYWAWFAWVPGGRTMVGEMPFEAQTYDMVSGLFSTGHLISYTVATLFALFAASKRVAAYRLIGLGARGLRTTTWLSTILAFIVTVLTVALAYRLDTTLDMPSAHAGETRFSPRTRGILMETRGEIVVTSFLSRHDARFRETSHFLRALARLSDSLGGAHLKLRFVDPKWDVGEAERLVREGVRENTVVFRRHHRTMAVPLAEEALGERAVASALLSVVMPPQRRVVYWTAGHGEAAFDDYGPMGLSDMARELLRNGYRNSTLDLSRETQIPSDCALVVIAGARTDFARVEVTRLEAYLHRGGRLLVLSHLMESGGLASLLAAWGVRSAAPPSGNVRTLSGSDVVVSEFSDHAIVSPLAGGQIVLERPIAFAPSAAAAVDQGTDRIRFVELARAGDAAVAAVSERGVGAGRDLALPPTRLVVIGDEGLVLNASLAARANANRDFFMNCVAYLSGSGALTEAGLETDRLVSGMDAATRLKFFLHGAVCLPLVVLFVLGGWAILRRRRV